MWKRVKAYENLHYNILPNLNSSETDTFVKYIIDSCDALTKGILF